MKTRRGALTPQETNGAYFGISTEIYGVAFMFSPNALNSTVKDTKRTHTFKMIQILLYGLIAHLTLVVQENINYRPIIKILDSVN